MKSIPKVGDRVIGVRSGIIEQVYVPPSWSKGWRPGCPPVVRDRIRVKIDGHWVDWCAIRSRT